MQYHIYSVQVMDYCTLDNPQRVHAVSLCITTSQTRHNHFAASPISHAESHSAQYRGWNCNVVVKTIMLIACPLYSLIRVIPPLSDVQDPSCTSHSSTSAYSSLVILKFTISLFLIPLHLRLQIRRPHPLGPENPTNNSL